MKPRSVSPEVASACRVLADDHPDLTPAELSQFLAQRRIDKTTGNASVPGQLLNVTEAAKRLQVGPRTIWRWVAGGIIAPVRLGRVVRFRETDVLRVAQTGVPRRQHGRGA